MTLEVTYDYDLFVIGAGSGGVRASRMAAAAGQRVAVAEQQYLGGTCVNVGCVPKKLFVYASHYHEDFTDAAGFGWDVSPPKHNWQRLIENKNQEINRLNGIYLQLLENAGVDIVDGRAEFVDSHTVEVSGKQITAERILIAVGGEPIVPDTPGAEYVITSNEAFYLDACPERVVIIGGGYIAVEFAGIFNGLGVETHLVYRGSQLLRHFDHAVAQFVTDEMTKKGIHIHFNTTIDAFEKNGDGIHCQLSDGSTLIADQAMCAIGRRPLTEKLGLENTKVSIRNSGSIVVDDRFATDDPAIFALGDVIGTPELTPVALAQAMVFVDQQFGEDEREMDYHSIPTAIFSQPNMATVGLSEEAVRAKKLQARVYTSEFRHLKHTLSNNSERVLMKMIVESETDVVLGIHMAGPDAGEIIQGFGVAVKAGLTKSQFDATIGIHPTAAEELVTLRQVNYAIE
ncbi:Glutathione amide reductase [BD1-7 clade bacterium]|uniref:Glutathione amide reductase n=1 Tax=BD1-7 clade bacterium TaxID=2029982 RepID=A0A5S9QKQ0_9GAMM|nr:Glutathione amide reductase [BD1-7 clade bacterium]